MDYQFNDQERLLTLTAPKQLDRLFIESQWTTWQSLFEKYQPKHTLLKAHATEHVDTAGIACIRYLKKHFSLTIEGLKESTATLLEHIESIPYQPQKKAEHSPHWLVQFGIYSVSLFHDFRDSIIFLGQLAYDTVRMYRYPRMIRWKTIVRQMEINGPSVLPIVLLLGFLLGLIVSFQSAIPLKRFGTLVYIANMVGIALTRELGPLMVAIILAGRTASSFAAELGTMKVNQEIDALKTMGLNPMTFLILPRIIAVMFMTPLLTVFMIAAGVVGCGIFMGSEGYTWSILFKQMQASVKMNDLWGGLFKSVVFGMLITSIGCFQGLRTRFGASAVGNATTRAVVQCIIMIVIVDGIFAFLFYALGI